ncbi:MAG: sterol carrier protein domain-containing protein [Euzebya sp.]
MATGRIPGAGVCRHRVHQRTAWDNAGAFHLLLERGQAELAPARRTSGMAQIDIGALSALYTGHVTASGLARQGRLTGGRPEDIAALDQAFAGPGPWMHDYF